MTRTGCPNRPETSREAGPSPDGVRQQENMEDRTMKSPIRNTIDYLRCCQQARAAGYAVAYTTNPAWLLHIAINRRAGWPDDPSTSRGSAMPVNGKYPAKASGDSYNHLCLLARQINTPRLIVRLGECGEWRKLIVARIPDRLFTDD